MKSEGSSTSKKETIEIKQVFLSSAISDISSYIQLSDTKVSIIMAAVVAFIAAVVSCYKPIFNALSKIPPCSWIGVTIVIFSLVLLVDLVGVFVFGILTIRGHSSKIGYKSKWFLVQSTKEYSFDTYKKDVRLMSDEDIIENMAAELYKLNDINQQKLRTYKWVLRCFSIVLMAAFVICILLVISVM